VKYHRHSWEASVDAVRAAVLSEDRPGFVWLETQSVDPFGSLSWLAAGAPLKWHRPAAPSGAATPQDWEALVAAWRAQPTWWLGMLSYDLKSVFEPTVPQPQNRRPEEPDFLFFEPSWVVYADAQGTWLELHPDFSRAEFDAWWAAKSGDSAAAVPVSGDPAAATRSPRVTMAPEESHYRTAAESLLEAMRQGSIYEANLCLPWVVSGAHDAAGLYVRWKERAQPPQGGCARFPGVAVVSGSPERYLQVRGRTVRSRPIKGTAPRSADADADAAAVRELSGSSKERAENTMVVDVVRNDLSRVAIPGTVCVPQWCEVETFPTVHQMVSTVEAQLAEQHDFWDAVAVSFPMASMTGAPKIEAMKQINAVEGFARGWYSGALGYIRPNGDADFNVVIRSAVVGTQVRLAAGSALTLAANPQSEWEECQLKVNPLLELVRG
jgi:para-aminobenzoate synthetase component 1